MAVRNLYRQAWPFRILGWGLFATILVLLPVEQLDRSARIGGLLLAVLGAVALDGLRLVRLFSALKTRTPEPKFGSWGVPPSDALVQRLQRVELLLVPGMLLILRLPLPLVFAVLGVLVNANVALGGGRSLPSAFLAMVLGVSVVAGACVLDGADVGGLWAGEYQLSGVSEIAYWLPGALMVLVFSVALCDVGFRLTQKLDDHRRLWQDRLTALQPFVPHGLSGSVPSGQQRCWLTVVILDLVEFTARSSPLPPELVSIVLDDLLDAVVVHACSNGGTLDKFMGDGALLFFTPEPSRAVGASKALGFARDVLANLPELNSRWAGFGLPDRLQLRLGISSGYCSVGECGTSDIRAYTIIGTSVGLAERLQAASSADSMALCPLTARLLVQEAAKNASNGGYKGTPNDAVGSEITPEPLPDKFALRLHGREFIEFFATLEELKGFAPMRVFRPSAKVRTPLL